MPSLVAADLVDVLHRVIDAIYRPSDHDPAELHRMAALLGPGWADGPARDIAVVEEL